jgi:hypothetical protein
MKRGKSEPEFVVCLQSGGNDDLLPRKIYQVLPDRQAKADGLLRVIDESGEDYLYPEDLFSQIHVPRSAQRAFLVAA